MNPAIETWIVTVLGTLATMVSALAVPSIREAVGKYVAGFVQHHFDQRIEQLKSDLRRTEEKFAADLRMNEQQLRSLADTALSLSPIIATGGFGRPAFGGSGEALGCKNCDRQHEDGRKICVLHEFGRGVQGGREWRSEDEELRSYVGQVDWA